MLLRVTVLTVVLLGLVVFSVLLAKVTLTPSPASEDIVTSNLRPGRSLRQYAEDYTFLAACKQAGGNLLLGVPFGLLLPFLVPRRLRMLSMTLLTAAAMILVELVQGALVTGRAFDIDDVILNTSGALLGYFLLGRRISHSYHAHAHAPRAQAVTPEAEPKAEERATPSRTKEKTLTKAGAKTKTGTHTRGTTKAKESAKAGTGTGRTRLTKARGASGRPTGDGAQPGSGRALLDRLRRR
ncbi:teicoplanin resistance protein VanZ [Streptomyces sp. CB00316]|uniref:VanZ family protein n=1 Tax=unclassified Streptomyces TaxID=2593676 RepID=UPI00095AF9F5|nr:MULTISPECIES: VanZ family protein [unclassified Streptomyces]OKJ18194.1 teicoplanin resistance protein VanZ [Streptomyces sp. CB00316]